MLKIPPNLFTTVEKTLYMMTYAFEKEGSIKYRKQGSE